MRVHDLSNISLLLDTIELIAEIREKMLHNAHYLTKYKFICFFTLLHFYYHVIAVIHEKNNESRILIH